MSEVPGRQSTKGAYADAAKASAQLGAVPGKGKIPGKGKYGFPLPSPPSLEGDGGGVEALWASRLGGISMQEAQAMAARGLPPPPKVEAATSSVGWGRGPPSRPS